MPKISVIVPVYKVENYLSACLDSISRQTLEDFELILVDDGSPDSCGAICDAYAANHPNTKVIHQENMGLSEARNQGVRFSSGEYIAFIDSDDYVTPDYLEYLFFLVQKYDADVSMAKEILFWDGQEPAVLEKEPVDQVMTPSEALNKICYNKLGIYAWGKLYKRHLVEKYPYPTGQIYEDTATTYKLVGDANAFAVGTRVIYYWRQRQGSITHDAIAERHLYGITAAKEQLQYMKNRYPEVVPAARARCGMKIIDLAYRLIMGKKDRVLFERIRNEAKSIYQDILRDSKAGLSLKVRILTLRLGYIPYLLLSKVYFLIKK